MRTARFVVFATFLLVLVTSCSPTVVGGSPRPAENLTTPLPDPNVVVTATDGLSELTMPRGWRNLSGKSKVAEHAVIVVADPAGQGGITVHTFPNTNVTFTKFQSVVIDLEIDGTPGTKQLEKPLTTTLGELPAVRWRVSRKGGHDEVTIYAVNGDRGYYLVKGTGYAMYDIVMDSWREVTAPA